VGDVVEGASGTPRARFQDLSLPKLDVCIEAEGTYVELLKNFSGRVGAKATDQGYMTTFIETKELRKLGPRFETGKEELQTRPNMVRALLLYPRIRDMSLLL
jgi:hypothetical protein